jgi:hypothetical protein
VTDPSTDTGQSAGPTSGSEPSQEQVYRVITLVIQAVLLAGVIGFLLIHDWANAGLTMVVIVLTLLPWALRRWLKVDVPPEFQLVAAVFVFCAMFLGTSLGFYNRFYWWDTALHTTSGCLLGIIGFIAVFLINGTNYVPEGMSLAVIAVFGFTFSVTLGVFWEIYEFIADHVIPGLDMQVVATGTSDTMVDMIVNMIGAAVVALIGYFCVRSGRDSFIVEGVRKFVRRNPKLFARRPAS